MKKKKKKESKQRCVQQALARQRDSKKTGRDWENGKKTEAGRLSEEPKRQKKRQLKWR